MVCAVCGMDRPVSDFSIHPKTGDPDATCLLCRLTCQRCGKTKPANDFPRHRGMVSGRWIHCKPCHNRQTRESKARHGGNRNYHLRERYGITAADVDAMIAAQGGLCPICERRRAVHVDHDHRTGKVRAILCEPCNGMLGLFKDDPEIIASAIEYLEKHARNRRQQV